MWEGVYEEAVSGTAVDKGRGGDRNAVGDVVTQGVSG